MNYCPVPDVDDLAVLFAHARNRRLKSFPQLLEVEATLIAAYGVYIANDGNAHNIPTAALSVAASKHLRDDYDGAPASVGFITKMRKEMAHKVCAMCGSFGSETLDHLLPRATFPEFSVFSRNLVPACPCNTIRSDVVVGETPDKRVLHPYFDQCLGLRLLTATFEPPYDAPKIEYRVSVDLDHPNRQAIEFHVETVVRRTAIRGHLADRWATLWRSPRTLLPQLPTGLVNALQLENSINSELGRLDDLHQSRNNWDSIFMSGLRDQNVRAWLLTQVNSPPPALL